MLDRGVKWFCLTVWEKGIKKGARGWLVCVRPGVGVPLWVSVQALGVLFSSVVAGRISDGSQIPPAMVAPFSSTNAET